MAVPDKRKTFDRERQITPIEHIVADYEQPSRERDYEAFLDFARYVSCRTFKVRPESEYRELGKHLHDIDYSIHFHVWDEPAFRGFLNHLSERFDSWSMQVVDHLPTADEEFIYVLEKSALKRAK